MTITPNDILLAFAIFMFLSSRLVNNVTMADNKRDIEVRHKKALMLKEAIRKEVSKQLSENSL